DTQSYGTTTITAAGIATAYNRFIILPEVVSVSPTKGTIGTIVTINCTGYAAGDMITVVFGTNANIQQAEASVYGTFSTTWTVDTQSIGTTTITVCGISMATNVFEILPNVYEVIPTSGTVGTIVTIQGTGYAAGDHITVSFGTNANIQQTVVSSSGSFSTTWTVDIQEFGTTTITVIGAGTATNIFQILPEVVSVVPSYGTVGTIVTIQGTGFVANDSINITFGMNLGIQTANVSSYGTWTASFTVDTQRYGTTTVSAMGIVSAYNRYFIMPELYIVTPTKGTVGSMITVAGTGFVAMDTLNVAFGTNNSIHMMTTNNSGWFTTIFTVDTQSYGTTTITVSGSNTSVSAAYFILPELYEIMPISGTVGTIVTISGTGYAANDNITVSFGTNAAIQTAAADICGWFSTTFTV
ncbi:MAG: IPT/TIG domain-containing protein, partial [bacterium]|nr:IPT/TIG domain-containing protein [bacterium]